MGIQQYSAFAKRMDLPKKFRQAPAALQPPSYSFAQDYVLYRTRCQRVGTKRDGPRVLLLEGFTMPAQPKGPETNALYKSALFRPSYCSGGATEIPKCDKLQPFERLSDKDNGTCGSDNNKSERGKHQNFAKTSGWSQVSTYFVLPPATNSLGNHVLFVGTSHTLRAV